MKIVLAMDYACAPEGHTVVKFKAGDEVTGKAAELALADGAAFEAPGMGDLETKVEEPDETKDAPRKRGRPPKAKVED